jgi:ribosomal protein L40E
MPVHCPKCHQANDGAAERCVRCQAHLYVQCRDCGAKNPRAEEDCLRCGTSLHRVKRKRRTKAPRFENDLPTLYLACLLILLALIGWALWHSPAFKRPL